MKNHPYWQSPSSTVETNVYYETCDGVCESYQIEEECAELPYVQSPLFYDFTVNKESIGTTASVFRKMKFTSLYMRATVACTYYSTKGGDIIHVDNSNDTYIVHHVDGMRFEDGEMVYNMYITRQSTNLNLLDIERLNAMVGKKVIIEGYVK